MVNKMSSTELFEAISHPIRIKILELLAEKPLRFADLKRKLNLNSSGQLDFHLRKLGSLITTDSQGNYILTREGYAALQAVTAAKKYGWQRRALLLNVIVYVAVNLLAFIMLPQALTVILPLSTAWIVFYLYWSLRKRRLKSK